MVEKIYGKIHYAQHIGRDPNHAYPEYKSVVNLLSSEPVELMTWHNENTPISHYEDSKFNSCRRKLV